MELESTQKSLLPAYLASFDHLIGDARTGVTFGEIVKGIIGAGSLVCRQIAGSSAILSEVKNGARRVRRLAKGKSTKRSSIDAKTVMAALRERAIQHLSEISEEELWVIADLSELRKPDAQAMPAMMQVLGLDGGLISGYRTLNVLGLVPSRRGVLYHRLFSSQEEGFLSESLEIQTALQTVKQALKEQNQHQAVTWITDTGFDDVAVWRTIWEQEQHVVCRLKHKERLIKHQDECAQWVKGDVQGARQQLRLLATARTEMVVRRGRQRKPKRQPVRVKIHACPIRLTYRTNCRAFAPCWPWAGLQPASSTN